MWDNYLQSEDISHSTIGGESFLLEVSQGQTISEEISCTNFEDGVRALPMEGPHFLFEEKSNEGSDMGPCSIFESVDHTFLLDIRILPGIGILPKI